MALKKSLSARRIPRKIGGDDEEESSAVLAADTPQESAVKRPTLANKLKKKSNLRMSFGPGEVSEDFNDDSSIATPKKTNLSRVAIENKAKRSSLSNTQLPFRIDLSDDGPSYSKAYLDELKQSTPSTPARGDQGFPEGSVQGLDIAAKFGPLAALQSQGSLFIPSEAEIREKKERRKRLAKEDQYMSLAADDPRSEDDEITDDEFKPRRAKNFEIAEWKEQHKYGESRIIREDEDLAEGFDDYVEDGGVTLGRKAEREAQKKRRSEIASMIADAEGGSSDDGSSDSEAERNAAYEAAQARAGAYGTHGALRNKRDGRQTPPRISPLPNLQDVTQRLHANVRGLEEEKATKMRRLEELRAERAQVKEREGWIQSQLKLTGENYEKLRIEAGMGAGARTPLAPSDDSKLVIGRGLESLGATPAAVTSDDGED